MLVWRRVTAMVLILGLTLTTGCGGGRILLTQEDLQSPPEAKSYEVTTRDGRVLTLVTLRSEGGYLVGTQRITREVTVGEGEEARTNVTNRYEEVKLPLEEVDRVEADPRSGGSDKGILLTAGAIAAGVAAFLLITSGDDSPSDGGGGKEF